MFLQWLLHTKPNLVNEGETSLQCENVPQCWRLVNGAALFFQMLLSFWGLLNNCACKKKITTKTSKFYNRIKCHRVFGIAEYCIMLHSTVFQVSWKYLCTVLGSPWAPIHSCNGRIWSHAVYSGNILVEICEIFMCKVISRMNVLPIILSWIIYSSLGERTAVAQLF